MTREEVIISYIKIIISIIGITVLIGAIHSGFAKNNHSMTIGMTSVTTNTIIDDIPVYKVPKYENQNTIFETYGDDDKASIVMCNLDTIPSNGVLVIPSTIGYNDTIIVNSQFKLYENYDIATLVIDAREGNIEVNYDFLGYLPNLKTIIISQEQYDKDNEIIMNMVYNSNVNFIFETEWYINSYEHPDVKYMKNKTNEL